MMEVPEWLVLLVGRLVIENEALRRELSPSDPEAEPEPTT